MQKIIWTVQYLAPPPALRYCKHCGVQREFLCSGRFRINAQRRSLDIWLIYKCADCDTTWNATVCSRISPQSLPPGRLTRFCENDSDLALEYAMDASFLRQNGAEPGQPQYTIQSESFSLDQPICLEITTPYPSSLKVSTLLREKLHLSGREYQTLLAEGKLSTLSGQDLRKCRLGRGITLLLKPH